MAADSLYPYTHRNLLDEPEYYMFSAYQGHSFLRGYYEQRTMEIADFEQRYLNNLRALDHPAAIWIKNWKHIIKRNEDVFTKEIQVIHSKFLSIFKEERSPSLQSFSELDLALTVNTGQYLRLLLQTSVARDSGVRENYLLRLNYFITRFEVSKKLYIAYQQASVKKASEEYRNYLNYALLSLTLLFDYEWSENLKMINTAIKLNDLLCSLGDNLTETETLLAVILALHKEKNCIRQLMADKRVLI